MADTDFVERGTGGAPLKTEELESMEDALQAWQETPGAFYEKPECKVIGRKA